MLLTLASLVLLQVPPDGVLTLELGEQRKLKLPGLQRVAVSVGQADCKTIGNDELLFLGTEVGKSPFHGWLTNGKHVTFMVNVVPSKGPRPVPTTTTQKGDVTVFEFNEDLAEITETREVDGGLLIRGKNRKGLGVEVLLTPKK
jgi:Pilus formation protein N terminal region